MFISYSTTTIRILIFLLLIPFSVLTAVALWNHGFLGILLPPFQSLYAGQVFADLFIALTLVMVWMWRDAKSSNRNPWPWIAATLVFGSFGPLVYLLLRKPNQL